MLCLTPSRKFRSPRFRCAFLCLLCTYSYRHPMPPGATHVFPLLLFLAIFATESLKLLITALFPVCVAALCLATLASCLAARELLLSASPGLAR